MKFVLIFLFFLLEFNGSECLRGIITKRNYISKQSTRVMLKINKYNIASDDSHALFSNEIDDLKSSHIFTISSVAAVAILFLTNVPEAVADASSYGVLAGRTASMMHPLSNFALFATSIYSAYLGLQWRRLREIGEEIKSINSELPTISIGKVSYPISDTVNKINEKIQQIQLESTTSDTQSQLQLLQKELSQVSALRDVNEKIESLTNTRKSLISANLKDKHFATGSILLGVGVTVSILGAFNTYMRAGKLFPGPHLYAGAAITILWAVASALVPQMQKGNEAARVAHIGLNCINILLFAYQIPTGIEIMLKVWEKTSWP